MSGSVTSGGGAPWSRVNRRKRGGSLGVVLSCGAQKVPRHVRIIGGAQIKREDWEGFAFAFARFSRQVQTRGSKGKQGWPVEAV
jgi:hypothetical protein